MIRELFHLGPLSISPFGVLMALAFLACYFQLRQGFRRYGIGDEEDASAITLAAGIGGILGAKVYFAILYGDWRLLLERYGLVWYGGFIVGTLAVLWVIRRRRLPIPRTADVVAATVALGYGIGRVGCFLVGDDYGRPTDLPWGVAFAQGLPESTAGNLRGEFGVEVPAEIPDAQLLAVHPTQLYETVAALLIWLLGLRLLRSRGRPGSTALVVFALLAVERFSVEFLRAKDDRLLGLFTVAQAISLLVLVVLGWVAASRRPRESAA